MQDATLQSVVAKLNSNLRAAKTLSFTTEISAGSGPAQTYRIKAMRPNFYRVEGENSSFYSDGQESWLHYSQLKRYLRFGEAKEGMHIPLATGFAMFSPPPNYKDDYQRLEKAVFKGKSAFALVSEPKQFPNLVIKLYVDPQTHLPVGVEQTLNKDVQTSVYRDVRLDEPMTAVDFVWTPPADAKRDGPATTESFDLLKEGQKAPDFSVPSVDGKKRTLTDLLKGKKALLVNFWFINCGYCLLEMPHLDALYKKLKNKGLEMFVVNDVDSAADVKEFLRKPKYGFPVGLDTDKAMAKAYKVADKGHPITYLIDESGNVVHIQIGFSEKTGLREIEKALAKLGVS